MRCPASPPCPMPEGQGSRSGQTSVETISVVVDWPSQPATRLERRAKRRSPTRGGRQPWERASTRGHTRQSTRTSLRHRGTGSTDFIAVDYEELVFVDAATKCGGYDMPHGEPDLERFERIAAAYLAEAEVEGLTSIRYDIVSLL